VLSSGRAQSPVAATAVAGDADDNDDGTLVAIPL